MKKLIGVLVVVIIRVCGRENPEKNQTDTASPGNYSPTTMLDICDLKLQQLNIICNCDKQQSGFTVLCLVFNDGESADAEIWNVFSTQPQIERLEFIIKSKDSLTFIPTKALQHLKEIKALNILFANITSVDPFAFSNSFSLQELNLKRIEITTLHPYSFANLPALRVIDLDGNKIREVQRDVFIGLPSLKRLFINDNSLTDLHDGCFSQLRALEVLDLSNNKLIYVTKKTFSGLNSLKILYMNHNFLTIIGDYSFSEVPVLEELILEDNQLECISEKAFHGLSFLSKLLLGNNMIKSLPDNVFIQSTKINYLDLSKNRLETLTQATMTPLLLNFRNMAADIVLQGNPFVCHCHLSWLYHLLNHSHVDILNVLKETKCLWYEKEKVKEVLAQPDVNCVSIDRQHPEKEKYGDHVPKISLNKLFFNISLSDLPCDQTQTKASTPKSSGVENDRAKISISYQSHPTLSLITLSLILLISSILKV